MPDTPAGPSSATPTVEVFADIWCPFAYVGLTRFLQARDEVAAGLAVVIRAWPLEWVNGAPLDSALVAEEVADLRGQVAPELFEKLDTERFPSTTVPALALTALAYRNSTSVGEDVAMGLRRALFEEGIDVSDPEEIAHLADHFALVPLEPEEARQLVAEEHQRGVSIGVKGSPHFFAGPRNSFCPSLHISRTDEHLRVAPDPERLRAWLHEILT